MPCESPARVNMNQTLALAVLLVSCACQASGTRVAEIIKDRVGEARDGTLAGLDTAQSISKQASLHMLNGLAAGNGVVQNAVTWCRTNVVDGLVNCCCAVGRLASQLIDAGIVKVGDAVARCPHAECAAIGSDLTEIAEDFHDAVQAQAVSGTEIAQQGGHLALDGVEVVSDLGHIVAATSVGVGQAAADVGFALGKSLVNKVADGNIVVINAVDNALGGQSAGGRGPRPRGLDQ